MASRSGSVVNFGGSAAASHSGTINIQAGTNRQVKVDMSGGDADPVVSSVTVTNGANVANGVQVIRQAGSTTHSAEIWLVDLPDAYPTGNATVAVNYSTQGEAYPAAQQFNDSELVSGSEVATGWVSGATERSVAVPCASGDLAVDCIAVNTVSGVSVGAGQTQYRFVNSSDVGASSEETSSGSSVTMSWTVPSNVQGSLVACALRTPSGGGGTSILMQVANNYYGMAA